MLNFIKTRIAKLQGKSLELSTVYINTMGTHCTNRCYMCSNRTIEKKNTIMPRTVFEKTIAQLKELNFEGELHLYGQNEPFLDKQIVEKIHYAHNELPNAKIVLISNFTVLFQDKIKDLLEAPIHHFSCSIYALKPENYAKICGQDNFKLSFINQVRFIKEFAEIAPFSFGVYLLNSIHNQDDIDFCKYFMQELLPTSYLKFNIVYGIYNTRLQATKRHKGFISHCVSRAFLISNNGDISICPCDASYKMKIGNITTENKKLKDLLNSSQAKTIRKRMLKNNTDEAYCGFCDYWRAESKLFYFLPIPNKLRDYLNKKYINSYKHENTVITFNKEEILQRLSRFNEIFKDNEEDKWLDCLEVLRKDFYANKIQSYKFIWNENIKVKG